MRKLIGSVMMALSLVLVAAATRADEEKTPLDKVPAPALEAVKKRFPGAEMKGASKETEAGKTVYEVTLKDKGLQVEVTVTPEGKLVTIEREIALKDVPEAVRKTFAAKAPNAKLELIEEVIKVEGDKGGRSSTMSSISPATSRSSSSPAASSASRRPRRRK